MIRMSAATAYENDKQVTLVEIAGGEISLSTDL